MTNSSIERSSIFIKTVGNIQLNEVDLPDGLEIVIRKDFNREKFEISIKKEIEIKKQNECKHIEIEVDSDEDLHNCLECGKKFTAHEYLVFKALDNSRIKFHSYTLKNDIHFLEQEKVQLENFVNDLKSQKHKLSSWITRTKKQNDIKNNDWNATSNG